MMQIMLSLRCSLPRLGRPFAGAFLLAILTGSVLAAPLVRAQTPTPRPVISAFTPSPANPAPAAASSSAPPPSAQPAAGVNASYTLSPNDAIQVEVYQEDDLRSATVISQEGTISFPLIGTVKVGGLTQTQARDRIADLLRARFLVSPQVSVTVVRFASKRFTILGQVNRPGPYEIPAQEKIDLLEAIAMAGGYTRIAKASGVTVRRHVGDSDKIFTLNADKMAKKTDAERFMVSPGDSITVPESIF